MPVRLFTIVPSMQSVSKLGQHVIIRSHVTFVRTFDGCISVGKNMMQDLNEFIVATAMIEVLTNHAPRSSSIHFACIGVALPQLFNA